MEQQQTNNERAQPTPLLQGRVALITGASRGIGAATARLFSRHGAAVGVNYHTNAARAQEVVEAIRADGGHALAIQADVANAQEVAAMVTQVERELGPIDTLVMNAIAGRKPSADAGQASSRSFFAPLLDSDWEQYRNVALSSLAGVYIPARIVAPLMVERKRGNLIAVSSLAARMPFPGGGALAAGKASAEALMRTLASELGPHGIRANIVSPGAVETEASAHVLQERREMMRNSLPLRRIAQPEDIAGAILLLATDEAGYLTGNYLAVGGGSYMP